MPRPSGDDRSIASSSAPRRLATARVSSPPTRWHHPDPAQQKPHAQPDGFRALIDSRCVADWTSSRRCWDGDRRSLSGIGFYDSSSTGCMGLRAAPAPFSFMVCSSKSAQGSPILCRAGGTARFFGEAGSSVGATPSWRCDTLTFYSISYDRSGPHFGPFFSSSPHCSSLPGETD
jgi:hypothetical protein